MNLFIYRTSPLKRPCQTSAHPHSCQKVLCRVNCTQTSAHCQLLVQRLDWSYGGPEVQQTRFWNPGLTTFRDDGIIYGRLGRSPITRFGRQTLTFRVRALTFRVQTPSSVCDCCVWIANIYVRMQTLKNHFFSYQLFIQLQGNRVLIDLGGRFHGSIAACSNNRPAPSPVYKHECSQNSTPCLSQAHAL